MNKRNSSIHALLFVIFNDALGWGVVVTIFAPLLLNPSNSMVQSYTDAQRMILIGFLLGSFGLTTLFAGPLLGMLSDQLGRRKVLILCILGSLASFALSAIAIEIDNLILLFASRLCAGLFCGNKSIARAAISDLSTVETKTKYFAFASLASDMSWILGPPLGGFLANSAWGPFFNYATPLWFVAALFLVNLLWFYFSFEETHTHKKEEKSGLMQDIRNFIQLSEIPQMKQWLIWRTVFLFGLWAFMLYYPIYFVKTLHFDAPEIGRISGYLAVWWLVGSFAVARWIKISARFNVLAGLLISSLGIMFTPLLSRWVEWLYILPFIAIGSAVVSICIMILVSNLADEENQGMVMGVQQSLASLSRMACPVFSGYLGVIDVKLPLIASGLILLATFGWGLMLRGKKQNS